MQEIQSTSIGTLIEPEPIAFSFGAPGWYILLGVFLLVALLMGIRQFIIYLKNKYRRQAISMIESIYQSDLESDKLIFKVAETLKRVSMISFGRSAIANQNGINWLNFIETADRSTYQFSPLMKKIYSTYLYQRKELLTAEERAEIKSESITWIKKHRV